MNEKIKLRYGVDEKLPFWDTFFYGLQWLAVSLPTIVVLGQIVANLHFSDPQAQVNYMQKIFFVMALSMLLQLFFGHRLPAVVGPASILLVAITASQGASLDSIYSSILIGGALLTLFSVSGLFSKLEKLFTRQVVATILLLIAFTLAPTIINLIFTVPTAGLEFLHFTFALALVFVMFVANRFLKGIWKSTLIIWALIFGSIIYILLVPEYTWVSGASLSVFSNYFSGLGFNFSLDIGVLISFIVCFIALSINDLGTIQALGQLLDASDMGKRVSSGLTVSGLSNVIAGLFGVIGPVNFSLSTGVIASTGIASRYTLVPTGIALIVFSFMPGVVSFLCGVPPLIIGVIFLYIMCTQVAAGMMTAYTSDKFTFEDGLTIGLPLMLGLVVSFLPDAAIAATPGLLRPILGNGFVVGTITVLVMEHLIFRKRKTLAREKRIDR